MAGLLGHPAGAIRGNIKGLQCSMLVLCSLSVDVALGSLAGFFGLFNESLGLRRKLFSF